MSIFSNRLRDIRNKRGLLQKDLAVSISVGPVTLSQYESGKREPDFDKLVLICKNLDVSADYLLGLTDTVKHSRQSSLPRSTPADPFSDLTSEQRTVIETTLNAFRQQNAASKEEA